MNYLINWRKLLSLFRLIFWGLLLAFSLSYSQHAYYYSRHDSLPLIRLDAKTKELFYPISMYNVKAIGLRNVQLALGNNFNAMMYNPAFLGRSKKSFEILSLAGSMPPETYDAAWFLSDNLDEFLDATSMTQIWDGLEAFFKKDATAQQRLEALHQIQDGMQFTLDMAEQVTGPAEEPYLHGLSVIPAITAQYGNLGLSFYGFGYSGFSVHLSPTLDYIASIEIPENLNQPLLAAKSLA